jgi:hypothetical protein
MATTINAGNATTGAAISADTTGIIALQTGSTPTTAVTINTSQQVGIGTASPAYKLDVTNSGSTTCQIERTDGIYALALKGSGTSSVGALGMATNDMVMLTNGAERMRITSTGNIGVGTTTANTNGGLDSTIKVNGTNAGIVFARSDVLKAYFYADNGTNSLFGQTETGTTIRFLSATGGVALANGATSWAAISDERNKENLTPILDALDKVNSLRTLTGKYKEDAEGTSRSFLIAQDVQAVLPEAIDIGTDEDATLSLRYTDIIPLLVASIQELNAKVDAQALEIQALKGVA